MIDPARYDSQNKMLESMKFPMTEQNALRAYLFSAICLGNCFLLPFAALLGERLESMQFPMT